jgi:ATP/maltotriose-dependent transcriptional regulator MalT
VVLIGEHLVGRAQTCGVFDDALVDLRDGQPAALSLVGEPGIGKTRLLVELAARANTHGYLVLSGSASELERDLPFWVFVDALDEYLRGLEPHRLNALDDETRSALAEVLPSLARLAGPRRTVFPHDRYRIHAVVRELLEELAAAKPLVLVLDDLHWADSASVELLGALLRRPPDAPMLMALSVRPRQMPDHLSGALRRADRAEALVRLEVGPLTQDEARQLLGESVDDETASALYEESGGNPFYLEQLARSLDRAPKGPAAVRHFSLAGLDVPPPVASDLAEELALLGENARLVLDGAAVAGDPFDPELAAAAAGTTEALALDAVDELLSLDLLHQTEAPRRFRFRHPIVRRAVYESTPAAWRLGAHERSAEALASGGAPATARAHHIERSARPGDGGAIATLREAGEALAHRAPTSAAHWFTVALELLPDEAPAEERVELLLAHAGALTSSGQFTEGHSALLESIALLPKDALALRIRLIAACAGVEHLLGRHEDAHRRLTSALDDLDEQASPEGVELMVELAVGGFHRMKYDTMRDWGAQALAAARQVGDQPLMAATVALSAWAAGLAGYVAEAEIHRHEAAGLIDAMPDSELALRLDAAMNLAGAELYLDRFEACGRHSERAVAVARATGQPAYVPAAFMLLSWARMLRGELADGAEMLDAAVEDARLLGNAHSLVGLLLNRSLTATAAGDLDVAVRTAKESVELTRGMDNGLFPAATALALAAALLETRDPELEEAVDLLLERCEGPGLPLMPGASFRAKWLELLTRCWVALGRPADAERAAACAQATSDAGAELRMARAMADRATAALELEFGDAHSAAQRALASADAGDQAGIPIEAALSRTLAARALAKTGQPERAVSELQQASVELHVCGAVRYRNAADQELRALGHRVQRRTARGGPGAMGVQSLTAREREVALLVVDRQTNPQIAERLFLSPKTVETHLRNIMRKLGVSSRVQVARAVEHADGWEPPVRS